MSEQDADLPNIESGQQDSSMPIGIKIGIPLFILFIIVASYFGYQAYQKSKNSPVFSDVAINKMAESDKKQKQVSVNQKDSADLPSEKMDDEVIIKLGESFSGLSENVSEIDNSIGKLKKEQEASIRRLSANKQDIIVVRNMMESFEQSSESLNKKIIEIEKRITSLHQTKKKNRRSKRPPFILLSMEKWDGQNSAVIEFNAKSAIAVIGDIRAGWRVASFSLPNCMNVIRLIDNQKATVCRTGER